MSRDDDPPDELIPERVGLKFWLILATKSDAIEQLESELGITQAQVVDSFIEYTEWSDDLPDLIGWRGTPEERRDGLRRLMLSYPEILEKFGTGQSN